MYVYIMISINVAIVTITVSKVILDKILAGIPLCCMHPGSR